MKRLSIVLLSIMLGLSLCVIGCQPEEPMPEGDVEAPAVDEAAGEPIVIGAILRLTLGASDGTPAKKGVEFAVEEINEAGGINGRPLEVIYEDSKDNATDAVNAANKLISLDKVPVIIGPMMSGNTLAAAPIAEDNGVVLISPNATSPKVSEAGEFIFRGCSRIDMQSEALVKYAVEKYGVKKAAILYSNEPYGEGFAKLLKLYFEEYGVEVVVEESFMRGDTDFKAQLTKISGYEFDLLCVPGYLQETAPAISQARTIGITAPSLGGFGDMAPLYIELAGYAGEGHIITGEYDEDYDTPKNKAFVKKYYQYIKENPKDPNNIMFAAITYDMVYLVAEAMKEVGTDPTAIKDYLDTVSDFDGVTGKLSFDENGDVVKGGIYIFEVVDGKYVKMD
ncbi:MAG: ABC transporter substrate-binding protein [Deltaproteobacteria bacterium]|nr:ABC transporter substrate-binding protein [Candidatus Zymogenaceae bacterium]